MPDEIILHHYPASPFSEKVRTLLAIKHLPWRSVVQPTIMPKPDLTPLTGGYRRIPVMQIGADVFCDSAVVMTEIERRWPNPRVIRGDDWAVNAWADRLLFPPTVGIIFGAIGHMVPEAFIKDREAMTRGRAFDVAAMKAAAGSLKAQFRAMALGLERRLADGTPFLAGDAPGLADIAAWMNVWFLFSAAEILAWRDRMGGLGDEATAAEMTPQEALDIAKAADPAPTGHVVHSPLDAAGLAPGAPVQVAADDYARDPVAGVLVAANVERIVIAREDARVGTVHAHFPRAGFEIRGTQA
jgi:glutathione S-transferase